MSRILLICGAGALILGFTTATACVGDDGATSSDAGGPGSESHPCFANGTCDPGLTCISNVCVDLQVEAGGKDAGIADTALTCDANVCGSACVDFQTSGAHCGRCDHSCLGGVCAAGACMPVQLASGQGNPGSIAVNATAAYWTNVESLGTWVVSVGLDGGATTTIATSTNVDGGALYGGANGLTLDSTNVYWTVGNNNNLVMKAPLDGGPNVVLTGGQGNPAGIVATATTLYWANFNYSGNDIVMMPIDGGTTTVIAPSQNNPGAVAIDATYLYWVNGAISGPSTIMKRALSGGSPILIATDTTGGAASIAVDGTSAYWTNRNTGTVQKVPLDGGTITPLASSQSTPVTIAVDATSVYWTNNGDGTIETVGIAGGTPKPIASGQPNAYGLTIDAVAVYWTTSGGTIMKVAKP